MSSNEYVIFYLTVWRSETKNLPVRDREKIFKKFFFMTVSNPANYLFMEISFKKRELGEPKH
jgi:hypothetical protein